MLNIAPGIVVLEKRPRWEAALKRTLTDPAIRVRGCRSAADALTRLTEMPGSVLVIDLQAGAADALRLTETVDRRSLTAGTLIVASTAEAELEWPFREVGARDFVSESLRGTELARLCQKQWSAASPGSTGDSSHSPEALDAAVRHILGM